MATPSRPQVWGRLDPLIGRAIDGRYEICTRLARGGMATVYIAIDKRLGREVAVKIMHPHLAKGIEGSAFAARFRREARAAAQLTHPATVAVYDQGVDGDISYLVTEYVPGSNLRKELRTFGTLPLGKSLAILEQVLTAIAAAHKKGLVHRDIKPENVLIDEAGNIKISDFGLARAISEITSSTHGTILGTITYLAPEVITTGISDACSDVYAVGILSYEILTGRPPHDGGTAIEVAFQQVNEDVAAPATVVPWLPQQVSDLVLRFAARDPRERPADGEQALAELQAVRQHLQEVHPHLLGRRAAPPDDYEEPDTGEIPEIDEFAGASDHDAELGDESADPELADPIVPVHHVYDHEHEHDHTGLFDAVTAVETTSELDSNFLDEIPTSPFTPAGGIPMLAPGDPRRGRGIPDDAVTETLAGEPLNTIVPTATLEPASASAPEPATAPNSSSDAGGPHNQRPRRPRKVLVSLVAALAGLAALGGGLGWWFSSGPGAWATVPTTLVNTTEESAISYLTNRHLLSQVHRQYSDSIPAGLVVSIEPPPGTQVRRGETVALTVSEGTQLVIVPGGLIGAQQHDAEAALRAAHVRFTTLPRVYSDTVPTGRVVGLSEPEGAEIPHYTMVEVSVSDGPRPFAVPQQVGREVDDAVRVLSALGLLVEYAPEELDETIPAGSVMRQDPPNGTVMRRGDTITLTISAGPPEVAVPYVIGYSLSHAQGILEEAGFHVTVNRHLGGTLNTVRTQSLTDTAPWGSTITLTVW